MRSNATLMGGEFVLISSLPSTVLGDKGGKWFSWMQKWADLDGVWWHILLTSAFGRQKQVDVYEF